MPVAINNSQLLRPRQLGALTGLLGAPPGASGGTAADKDDEDDDPADEDAPSPAPGASVVKPVATPSAQPAPAKGANSISSPPTPSVQPSSLSKPNVAMVSEPTDSDSLSGAPSMNSEPPRLFVPSKILPDYGSNAMASQEPCDSGFGWVTYLNLVPLPLL
ncbi:hypothetical protein DL96DRAFT_1556636 [Flagelloscypha sp. PMI_526]|nr:hypothetical protein DL96DRAFT_1556636 [Flagelloscypha sp. PMI_526]